MEMMTTMSTAEHTNKELITKLNTQEEQLKELREKVGKITTFNNNIFHT